MRSKIDSLRVDVIFRDCSSGNGNVEVKGIWRTAQFQQGRLNHHRREISEMLAELPIAFKLPGGRGASFLDMGKDSYGQLWTGVQETKEQLLQLGIGIHKVRYLTPRKDWAGMPGGVPRIAVDR